MKVKRKNPIISRKNKTTISMITQSIKSPIPMSNKNHLLNPKNKKRNRTLTLLKTIISNMNKKIASTYINIHHPVKKRRKRDSKVSIRMMTSQSQLLSPPRYWTITTLFSSINPQVTNRLSKINM
jgi:hypothetical protein